MPKVRLATATLEGVCLTIKARLPIGQNPSHHKIFQQMCGGLFLRHTRPWCAILAKKITTYRDKLTPQPVHHRKSHLSPPPLHGCSHSTPPCSLSSPLLPSPKDLTSF